MAEDELERWIAAFRGPLIGLLASWGTDWRAAEELAQDTFAEAWVSRERFRGDGSDQGAVGAWLRGIAFHLHSAARRREERGRAPAPLRIDEPDEPDEHRAVLVEAFAQLSGPHQTVLRMHYLEQSSSREVAALLGLTPKAVEGRLFRARKALRGIVLRKVVSA